MKKSALERGKRRGCFRFPLRIERDLLETSRIREEEGEEKGGSGRIGKRNFDLLWTG